MMTYEPDNKYGFKYNHLTQKMTTSEVVETSVMYFVLATVDCCLLLMFVIWILVAVSHLCDKNFSITY